VPYEDEGRVQDTPQKARNMKTTANHQKLGERHGRDSPPQPPNNN
jgi:hypothetical protein